MISPIFFESHFPWFQDAHLYIMWVDDNAEGAEAAYTIDDLQLLPYTEWATIPERLHNPVSVNTFECRAVSFTASFTYSPYLRWLKDGQEMDRRINPSAASDTLILTNLSLADAGQHALLAENSGGRATSEDKLREKLGEGCCGTIHLTEQTEPVRRRVRSTLSPLQTHEVLLEYY